MEWERAQGIRCRCRCQPGLHGAWDRKVLPSKAEPQPKTRASVGAAAFRPLVKRGLSLGKVDSTIKRLSFPEVLSDAAVEA